MIYFCLKEPSKREFENVTINSYSSQRNNPWTRVF